MAEKNFVRVFYTDNLIIGIEDSIYNAKVLYNDMKLEKNVAYIKGNYVYLYMGETTKPEDELDPGIYFKDGKMKIKVPESITDKRKYSIENIVEIDTESILDEIEKDYNKFMTAKELEMLSNSSDIYTPVIEEKDDFLKKMIKEVIIDKKINLANYREKLDNKWLLNNMRMGLSKDTAMSIKYFKLWCELLGINITISAEDNGTDTFRPLNNKVIMTLDDM